MFEFFFKEIEVNRTRKKNRNLQCCKRSKSERDARREEEERR